MADFLTAVEWMKQGKKVRRPKKYSYFFTIENFRINAHKLDFYDFEATDLEIVEEPKDTLWDKKFPFNSGFHDVKLFSSEDVKQALKEFLNKLKPQGHNIDCDSCLSSENYNLAVEIFGKELLK